MNDAERLDIIKSLWAKVVIAAPLPWHRALGSDDLYDDTNHLMLEFDNVKDETVYFIDTLPQSMEFLLRLARHGLDYERIAREEQPAPALDLDDTKENV